MKPSQLEILLLGRADLTFLGASVKIARRAERGIIYYLAAENRPVSRETLIDLLWPQAEQDDPRRALRTALSRLRNSLPDKSILVTEHDLISLDTSRCFVDLVQFSEAYQSLQRIISAFPKHLSLPAQLANQIRENLSLWHGDQIIHGEDLSDYPELGLWRQSLDNNMRLQRLFLMVRLAEHYQASGQLQNALDLFIQLCRLNNQDIPSHLAVMNLLNRLGRHQEVLEYGDFLEVIFEKQYNAPLPDQIIQCCRESQALIDRGTTRQKQGWPITLSMQVPLVGREREMERLRTAFYKGGLVKIVGDLGVGKTRLVQELYETLLPKPMLFLAPAREKESTLPLAPIIHGLRRHIDDSVWQDIESVWAAQLSLILPELIQSRADITPGSLNKTAFSSQSLFDALHHLFRLISDREGRFLFFLDDAHWADQQTIAVLSYLVRQGFFDNSGVLILAVRKRERNTEIDTLFDPRNQVTVSPTIELEGLNPAELKHLLEHVLKQSVSTDFVDAMYQETMGVPFWALELLHHFLDTNIDLVDLQKMTTFPLIGSAHAFFTSRVSRFSEDAQYLINCAAVIGDDIPLALLQSVSGLSQYKFMITVNELIQAGFLMANPAVHSTKEHLNFPHEKLRTFITSEINSSIKQALHLAVAEELSKAEIADQRAVVIAEHYKAGGAVKMPFKWYLKAATYAWNLGDVGDTIWAYQQAEAILIQSPIGVFDLDDVFSLYLGWSQMAFQSNQVSMLEELGGKLKLQSWKKLGYPMEGLAQLILAMACLIWEDFETGLILSKAAVTELKQTDQVETLIQAYSVQALFEWWLLDFENGFLTITQITHLLDNHQFDPSFELSTRFNAKRLECETYFALGEAGKAVRIAQETYQQFSSQLNTVNQLRAHSMLAHAYFIAGKYTLSHEHAHEGIRVARVLENVVAEIIALLFLSQVDVVCGHLDEGYEHAVEALKLAEKHNRIQSIVAANTILGDINTIIRNYDQAMYHYRIAQVRQGYAYQSYFGLENIIHLARLLTRDGQHIEARELLETALAVTEEKRIILLNVQALIAIGLVELHQENNLTAKKWIEKAISIADEKGLTQETMWAKYWMAEIAFSEEDYPQSEKMVIELLRFSTEQEMFILNKVALELATKLSRMHSLTIPLDKLQADIHKVMAKPNPDLSSDSLNELFLNQEQRWYKREPSS